MVAKAENGAIAGNGEWKSPPAISLSGKEKCLCPGFKDDSGGISNSLSRTLKGPHHLFHCPIYRSDYAKNY